MKICCKHCRYQETFNKEFLVRIIGGVMPVGGFWAWVTYFFAGTGLAFEICTALVVGGVGVLVFKDKIVQWLSKKYDCPKCNHSNWSLIK
ncbi:MAG: hypothetical protein CR960_00290 [Pasteurellales bacterium]|nr:MAG: hypothetical protein CR960_00290 [Pasteurellales bacterium]